MRVLLNQLSLCFHRNIEPWQSCRDHSRRHDFFYRARLVATGHLHQDWLRHKVGIIVVIFMAMVAMGILTLSGWSPFNINLYFCLGIIVFGIYLVIDTKMIVEGKIKRL